MNCDILELDVFSTGPFTANPVAVVAGADALTDEQMQRVAAWLNYSETTFLLPPTVPGADYRARIFSPTREFDFAGHPTLGTARAWLALGGTPASGEAVVQDCAAGLVPVRVQGESLAFATPPLLRDDALTDAEIRDICDAFDLPWGEIIAAAWGDNGTGWKVVQLRDVDKLRALGLPRTEMKVGFVALSGQAEPFCEVRALTARGEDPVTGSLNGAVAQWLRGRGVAPASYVAAQGEQAGRRGRVEITDDGEHIWVGGRVDVRVRGKIFL